MNFHVPPAVCLLHTRPLILVEEQLIAPPSPPPPMRASSATMMPREGRLSKVDIPAIASQVHIVPNRPVSITMPVLCLPPTLAMSVRVVVAVVVAVVVGVVEASAGAGGGATHCVFVCLEFCGGELLG